MNKKILFKFWKFPRLSETFFIAQIITAIKCGYDVNILVEEIPLEDLQHTQLIEKYRLRDKVIIEDYKIPRNKFSRLLKALFIIAINFQNIFKLKAFINNQNGFELKYIYMFEFYKNLRHYDIVHVQYGTNGKPLDVLKKIKFFPPKLIVSFHGHDVYFPINGILHNNGYYDILFKYSDKLIANTPYLKKVLLELNAPKQKIEIIPVGVNTNYFKPAVVKNPAGEVFKIITIGRLEIVKGQRYGIEVMRKLKDRGFKFHYTLLGTGSQEEMLKQLTLDYDLAEEITFLGKRPQNEIKALLPKQDIFLMTSVNDPDFGSESQGLVTAEAQASGVPVIGFDSGGVKYTIADNVSGYIVPEYDVNSMTEKVEIMIKNVELRLKMGYAARNYINKHFSQNVIDDIWCKTYKSLLD